MKQATFSIISFYNTMNMKHIELLKQVLKFSVSPRTNTNFFDLILLMVGFNQNI